jgi:hypothetical protein
MMTARKLFLGFFAFAVTSMPLSLFSQTAPESDRVQEWLIEIRDIQTRLAPLEERALLEPDIEQQQAAVEHAVLAAMIEADSSVDAKLSRLREIVVEAGDARDDQARLDALGSEASGLQPAIARAREKALERPEIAAQVAAFRNALYERMGQLAPESRWMVARYGELQRLINASLRQGANPPPVRGG